MIGLIAIATVFLRVRPGRASGMAWCDRGLEVVRLLCGLLDEAEARSGADQVIWRR